MNHDFTEMGLGMHILCRYGVGYHMVIVKEPSCDPVKVRRPDHIFYGNILYVHTFMSSCVGGSKAQLAQLDLVISLLWSLNNVKCAIVHDCARKRARRLLLTVYGAKHLVFHIILDRQCF